MYEWLMDHGGIRHLVMAWHQDTEAGTAPFDTVDAVEAVAWVEGVSSAEAAVHLLTKLRDSHEQFEMKVMTLGVAVKSFEMFATVHLGEGSEFFSDSDREEVMESVTELLGYASDEVQETEGLSDGESPELAQLFHAAGFVAAYRLMRDVESARAMCNAMEVFGEPVRELLFEDALPGSPALAFAWEPEIPGDVS